MRELLPILWFLTDGTVNNEVAHLARVPCVGERVQIAVRIYRVDSVLHYDDPGSHVARIGLEWLR